MPGRYGQRPRISVVRGPIVSEVRLQWADWAAATFRVYSGQGASAEARRRRAPRALRSLLDCAFSSRCSHAVPCSLHTPSQVDWTAGPIPIDDGLGKSLVLRLSTDLETDGQFWTDSNGREMMLRTRDQRCGTDPGLWHPGEFPHPRARGANERMTCYSNHTNQSFSLATPRRPP